MNTQNYLDVNNGVDRSAIISMLEDAFDNAKCNNTSVELYISNKNIECRNTIDVNGFELDKDSLSVSCNAYELHINFNDSTISYFTSEENNNEGDIFIFLYDKYNVKVGLVFLE